MKDKIDPHQHERYYNGWKAKGSKLKGLSKQNRELILNYLEDMELGRNIGVGSKKGSRSYGRLRNQKSKIHSLLVLIEKATKKKSIKEVTEKELMQFFKDMRAGKYKSERTGKVYTAVGTYVKAFKAFYHWYMKVSKKEGKELPDITAELDTKDDKPKFHYFTIEQLQKLCNNAKLDYKVLMMFMFDSGIRSPTELMNTKVSDLNWDNQNNYYTLNIREEVSKTFGRKIKLLLCSDILKSYLEQKKLKKNDYIFTKRQHKVNEYLTRLAYKELGIGKQVKKKKKGKVKVVWIKEGLTMYDFRHSSACYWLPRYKSESALKYRFGWKSSDMIHYYTEFLGMKDTIQQEDLYLDVSKTELEREISSLRKQLVLQDEQKSKELEEIRDHMKRLQEAFKGKAVREVASKKIN